MAQGNRSSGRAGELRPGSFVDAEWVKPSSDQPIDVINPSNGRLLYRLGGCSEEEVSSAAASARIACDDGRWSGLAPGERKLLLLRLAELVEAEDRELNRIDALEMGKPISERAFSAADGAGLLRFCAEAVDKIQGDVFATDSKSVAFQRKVPRGVVAAIVPWNFPIFVALMKIAPALAAGNCVILKPSEMSPGSAGRLVELARDAGFPPGVLNLVTGHGRVTGRALGLHADIDMITFTGSTAVGKLILSYSAESNMKVVMAECGGKSPHIVFDDMHDLPYVCGVIAARLLTNQGQICSVGSRLIIDRRIQARAVDLIGAALKQIRMGDAVDELTTFGPLASRQQLDRVLDYIQEGSGTLVCGGGRELDESGGYFVQPTLFADVDPQSRIAQEEIFGPVLSVIPFDNEEQAIAIANGTKYGLGANVWTRDISRALRATKGLRTAIRINAAPPLGPAAGHAGSAEPYGQSGIGVEGGIAGIESYMNRQLVTIFHA